MFKVLSYGAVKMAEVNDGMVAGCRGGRGAFFFVEPHGLPLFFADPLDITICDGFP